ncbi:MAG: signal peptidase I [Acidimicrobiia bacterium]
MTAITEPIRSEVHLHEPYSRLRLMVGIMGRAWLWFIAACVLVTLLPLLFGWQPYVIVTGSMEPGIGAGDVVLVSPDPVIDDTLGRIISFEDPARADHIVTHRVVSLNDDGTIVTKGDANPTVDSVPVPRESVTGLGRLLVQFVGLPVVWVLTGDWLPLLGQVVLLIAAVVATVLDYEPDNQNTRSWRRRIDQRQPADPRGLLSRPAPSVTLMLLIAVTATLGVPGGSTAATSGAVFTASSANANDGWAVPNWSYTTEVNALSPYLYWPLDETGWAATAADSSGNGRTGTYSPSGSSTYFTRLGDGALVTDSPDRAVQLGANACINTTSNTSINAPQVFTVIAWFRAPSTYTDGGKLVGFERPRTGVAIPTAGAYDRHLYMDGQGRIWFGVYNNAHVALSSAAGLNNDQWHMAVGTQSSAGMRLYIDGVEVASNGNTVAETQNGWWRAGCGNLSGWGDQWGGNNDPGTNSGISQNRTFAAALDEVTVYSGTALTPGQIAFFYWVR